MADAVVGLYSGLAAGLFANLIALVSGLALGFPRVLNAFLPESGTREALTRAFAEASWHFEYLIVGVPLGMGALVLARLILPGGPRDEVMLPARGSATASSGRTHALATGVRVHGVVGGGDGVPGDLARRWHPRPGDGEGSRGGSASARLPLE